MLLQTFLGVGGVLRPVLFFGALAGGLKTAVIYFLGYEGENTVTVSASMIL